MVTGPESWLERVLRDNDHHEEAEQEKRDARDIGPAHSLKDAPFAINHARAGPV